ncbi:MAG: hypothetical protein CL609_11605 [Anaerolineaceae bacterium]|nr:hypothetical protein [Anaerolineaceae bacterium]
MKLIFVRHGQSTANQLNIIANRGFQYPLTELGLKQTQVLAESLLNQHINCMYTSPLLRAVQTTEVLQIHLNVPFKIAPQLREYDNGILEGKSDDQSWKSYQTTLQAWLNGNLHQKPPQGESMFDQLNRFLPFINTVVQNHTENSTLLFVGHGGLYRQVLPVFAANLDLKWCKKNPLSNTHYVVIKSAPNKKWLCHQWGSHRFINE